MVDERLIIKENIKTNSMELGVCWIKYLNCSPPGMASRVEKTIIMTKRIENPEIIKKKFL